PCNLLHKETQKNNETEISHMIDYIQLILNKISRKVSTLGKYDYKFSYYGTFLTPNSHNLLKFDTKFPRFGASGFTPVILPMRFYSPFAAIKNPALIKIRGFLKREPSGTRIPDLLIMSSQ
ncbi:hypothetical protein ACFL40_01820, partial [candidate division KSB1 bacterium]